MNVRKQGVCFFVWLKRILDSSLHHAVIGAWSNTISITV